MKYNLDFSRRLSSLIDKIFPEIPQALNWKSYIEVVGGNVASRFGKLSLAFLLKQFQDNDVEICTHYNILLLGINSSVRLIEHHTTDISAEKKSHQYLSSNF